MIEAAPLALLTLVLFGNPLAAQQRRRQGGDGLADRPSAPITIPEIPRDSARPLIGVWVGEFRPGIPGAEPAPYTVVIEFLNGGYSGYTFVGPSMVRPAPMRRPAATGQSITWEQPNSGGGTLVFEARLVDPNQLRGSLSFRGDWPKGESPPSATFSLQRRERPDRPSGI